MGHMPIARASVEASRARPISPLDEHRTGYVFSADMMFTSTREPEHPESLCESGRSFLIQEEQPVPSHEEDSDSRGEEEEVALVHDKGIWDGVKRSACKC